MTASDPVTRSTAETSAAAIHENLMSAIALGKVLAFLVYSFLALFVAMGSAAMLHMQFPRVSETSLAIGFFIASEIALMFLVIRGSLPATSGATAMPFSENQAALGLAILSFVPWFFRTDPVWFVFFAWLVNGLLLLVAVVFFIVKSALTRRMRYEVLMIAAIPAVQIYLALPAE